MLLGQVLYAFKNKYYLFILKLSIYYFAIKYDYTYTFFDD